MGKYGDYAPTGGGGGKGLFLKIENGEAFEFLALPKGLPYQRYRKWNAAENKYEDCSGPGKDVDVRILFPVYVLKLDDVKILEMAPSTWTDLAGCLDHERVGGIEQIYEISRKSTGVNTRWKIQRIDRAPADRLARAARAELPDMERFGDPVKPASQQPQPVATGPNAASPTAAPAAGAGAPDDGIPF